jgi:hypothetical protein
MKQMRLNGLVTLGYLLAICFIVLRNFFSPWGDMFNNGGYYSHYNNYLIFRQSFGHLLESLNLYITYPKEYFDLYKYPPFFAMLMAPFYYMPVWLGYGIWTAVNVVLPVVGLRNLGLLNSSRGLILSLIILSEAITAGLNSQSNGIVVGLLLLSFSAAIKEKTLQSVIYIWLSAFIKIFGVLFFLIFLCFSKQLKKAILHGMGLLIVFAFIPAVFGGMDALLQHYRDWFLLLQNDFSIHVKYSVMGWLKSWFGLDYSKNTIILVGLIVQILPLFVARKYINSASFYWPYALSIIIWMVIFNHMAESATYIIAVVPIAVWVAYTRRPSVLEWVLVVMVLLFTILGPTDVYPLKWRQLIVETYQLKAFPCIVFWFYLLVKSILNNNFSITLKKQAVPIEKQPV